MVCCIIVLFYRHFTDCIKKEILEPFTQYHEIRFLYEICDGMVCEKCENVRNLTVWGDNMGFHPYSFDGDGAFAFISVYENVSGGAKGCRERENHLELKIFNF